MHHPYLKGYYGYRNLGDELLLIGVLRYLHQKHHITTINIEVQDRVWMQQRYQKNRSYFPKELIIHRVKTPSLMVKVWHMVASLLGLFPLLILGGGESINTSATFPHNGWNYLCIYRGNIVRRRYIILGGVHTRGSDDALAAYLLGHAQSIVTRESGSYQQASVRSDNVVKYQDFAKEIVQETIQKQANEKNIVSDQSDYVLVNLHPTKVNRETWGVIDVFLKKHSPKVVYFVPCDMLHDMSFMQEVSERYPDWIVYDRTKHTIGEIVSFFSHATAARGMRLHFLLLCHECVTPYEMIVYHDKVNKVLSEES